MANLPYIQAVSLGTQTIIEANTPQQIVIEVVDDINEFSLNTTTGVITYNKEGAARKFAYIIAPQAARNNVCQDFVPNFRCWIQRKSSEKSEFEDVENANVLMNVNTIRETKDVIPLSRLITLEKDDELRVMMASNIANEVKIEAIPMTNEPNIPSIIVSIFNIGLEKDE